MILAFLVIIFIPAGCAIVGCMTGSVLARFLTRGLTPLWQKTAEAVLCITGAFAGWNFGMTLINNA